jgi:hypothetical protein
LVSRNIEKILGIDAKEESRDIVVFEGTRWNSVAALLCLWMGTTRVLWIVGRMPSRCAFQDTGDTL